MIIFPPEVNGKQVLPNRSSGLICTQIGHKQMTVLVHGCMAMVQGRGLTSAVGNTPQLFRQKYCH